MKAVALTMKMKNSVNKRKSAAWVFNAMSVRAIKFMLRSSIMAQKRTQIKTFSPVLNATTSGCKIDNIVVFNSFCV